MRRPAGVQGSNLKWRTERDRHPNRQCESPGGGVFVKPTRPLTPASPNVKPAPAAFPESATAYPVEGLFGPAPMLLGCTSPDNSTVLQSRLFSRGSMVGIVDLARITRDQRGSLVRPGTSSAGAVCRAAELEGVREPNPQIPG
jgi:hypothetical protein